MKKSTVATSTVAASVLTAVPAQAAEIYNKDSNRLSLYGKVSAKHYFPSDDVDDDDITYAHLGFKGETQINDQLTGFGQWEYESKGNRAESQGSSKDKICSTFADLKFGDCGLADYGCNHGVVYDISVWTGVLPGFSGDTWARTDVFMTDRTTGAAICRNNGFFGLVDGLNFAAQYQSENDHVNVTEANGDGLGLSTAYEYEGSGIGVTCVKSDRINDQVIYGNSSLDVSDQNVEVWVAGLKCDVNNIYLTAAHSEAQSIIVFGNNYIANKIQNLEVVIQYQLGLGLRPSTAYLQLKGKDLGVWGDQDLVEYIDVGTTCCFNKNMPTLVDYKVNLIDKSDFTKTSGVVIDDIIAVGLVYQF